MLNVLNLEMRSVSFGPLLCIIFRHIQDFCSLLKDDTVPSILQSFCSPEYQMISTNADSIQMSPFESFRKTIKKS